LTDQHPGAIATWTILSWVLKHVGDLGLVHIMAIYVGLASDRIDIEADVALKTISSPNGAHHVSPGQPPWEIKDLDHSPEGAA
jgi:hypothetical protein